MTQSLGRYDHELFLSQRRLVLDTGEESNTSVISWEAQVEKAVGLASEGRSVIVHKHGWGQHCKTPDGSIVRGCVHSRDGATLSLVHETLADSEAPVNS